MISEADKIISVSDIFSHVRIINGIGISLCLSRILIFLSKFIQYPNKNNISYIHIGWIIAVILWIISFWWSYILEGPIQNYNLYNYLIDIIYVFSLFFICVTLTPDDVTEYYDYENYFFSRKYWLMSILIFISFVEIVRDIFYDLYANEQSFNAYELLFFVMEIFVIFLSMRIKRKIFHYFLVVFIIIIICTNFITQ